MYFTSYYTLKRASKPQNPSVRRLFDSRFIVASLDEPNGRNGSVLIGKKGTTLEEIFVVGVYQVYPFTRPSGPAYQGDDSEVAAFLEAAQR